MTDPWRLYDELIEAIPANVTVVAAGIGPQWCRVLSSEGGLGMAFSFADRSRPALHDDAELVGTPLRKVAALAKSWNFVEAGIGMAAVNAWHSHPDKAERDGFVPCADNTFARVFHPYSDAVAGKVVSVIGHFPFAPVPLSRAAELRVLERNPQSGDYPDSACEYLLPDSDYVFISGSAFVNKTMPRLLRLARNATTVVLGPSTPLSPTLFEHGVDVVTGFVPWDPAELFTTLAGAAPASMYDHGYRVEQQRRRAPGS